MPGHATVMQQPQQQVHSNMGGGAGTGGGQYGQHPQQRQLVQQQPQGSSFQQQQAPSNYQQQQAPPKRMAGPVQQQQVPVSHSYPAVNQSQHQHHHQQQQQQQLNGQGVGGGGLPAVHPASGPVCGSFETEGLRQTDELEVFRLGGVGNLFSLVRDGDGRVQPSLLRIPPPQVKNQGTASMNMGGRSETVENDHPEGLERAPLLQEQGGDDKKTKHEQVEEPVLLSGPFLGDNQALKRCKEEFILPLDLEGRGAEPVVIGRVDANDLDFEWELYTFPIEEVAGLSRR